MEATLNKQTVDLIKTLYKLVESKGVVKDDVVKKLMELRPHFIEQKEPLITRVIRLTAEYIDDRGYFDLNLLADEEVDEDDDNEELAEDATSEPQYLDVEIDMDGEDSFNESKQNFLYLLDLIAHPENERNKEELQRVKHLFLNRDFF